MKCRKSYHSYLYTLFYKRYNSHFYKILGNQ